MARKNSNGSERARLMVAQEAARIIVNQGLRDYGLAKKKAAERLGLNTRGSLPGNAEIEQAVSEHLQLFDSSLANPIRTCCAQCASPHYPPWRCLPRLRPGLWARS
jgi:hypothetical protein